MCYSRKRKFFKNISITTKVSLFYQLYILFVTLLCTIQLYNTNSTSISHHVRTVFPAAAPEKFEIQIHTINIYIERELESWRIYYSIIKVTYITCKHSIGFNLPSVSNYIVIIINYY